jgi:hypothetical protein
MFKSHIVDIAGHFVGVAVTAPERLRFVAVDPRVEELDGSMWNSVDDIRRVAAHLLATGSLPPRPTPAGAPAALRKDIPYAQDRL